MIDDFEQLKREVTEIQSKKDRASGALEQVLKKIKERFGCSTLEAAEALLLKKKRLELKAAEETAEKTEKFRKRHQKALEGLDNA